MDSQTCRNVFAKRARRARAAKPRSALESSLSLMRRILATAVLLLAASIPSAQRLPDIPAPPDVAAPPAEAVKNPSGLVSKVVTPGTGAEKPQDTDFVTVHYTGWSSE